MTTVYSAVFGRYDDPKPAPAIEGVPFVMFTDDAHLEVPGWEVHVAPPPADEHPRMSAKWFKLHPHLALTDEQTVWVDAAHTVSPLVWRSMEWVGPTGICLHRHFSRDCIYDEAEASMKMVKYQGQPIWDQVREYREEGHPPHWGLWECGTIASERGEGDKLFDAWWEEIQTWSYQDQISLPVVFRRAGVQPNVFPTDQYHSPWVRPGAHNRAD